MTVKTLTRSWAGGVVTPEMLGRLDLIKYQTGLAEADGFETLPHGPAANSPGFEYVLEVKDSSAVTCLLPFIYSTSQSMVLEFGNLYVRFHTAAGTLLETVKNITAVTVANPGAFTSVAHGYSTGDWVFVLGCGGMTSLNFRWFKVVKIDADHYTLTDLAGNAIDTSTLAAYTGGGTTGRVYEIVSPYATADLFDLHFTQSADVFTIVHTGYQQRELRRIAATNWTFTTLSFTPSIAAPAAPGVVATGAGAVNYSYVTTALAAGTLEESTASAVTAVANDITIAGNFNTVTPAAVAGSVRCNVYKLSNGLYGYIGQTDGSAFKDINVTPDVTRTPPLPDDPYTSVANYPGAVGYFQGRRWFGGTLTKPQNFNATQSGTESNMSYSIPSRDSDRLSVRIASRQANTIRHFVPLDDMLMLTSGGEWAILALNSDAITPSSVDPRPKGAIGASNVQPIITGSSVLYAQDRGGRMRELKRAGQLYGQYDARDISIMAPHLFDKYTIKQLAFTRAPSPVGWVVRSDGTLLGVTYVPEQQVEGWWTRTTQGTFESACAVPEGSEDALYVIVKRTINGRTVRYIERRHTRIFATLADAFFVDAGVFYNSAPTTTLTGLDHLRGATVVALADGAVVRDLVVGPLNNGYGVTLPQAASKVVIGLQISAKFKTLPIALDVQAAGQGTVKNINKVHMRVNESSGIYAGPTYLKLRAVKQRTTEPYGSPPALISDEKGVVITPQWNTNGQICVQQLDPLPITVLSMTSEVVLGG